ncbi:MAG: YjbQ family protein [Xanthomonadales bacterium]|nr:YjbQ family protein [Xanthomonadales bacterium]
MPAHVRSVLTGCSLLLPVAGGRLDLGRWQGLYLWEHRRRPHRRRVSVSLVAA